MRDHYRVLGVPPDARPREIRRAYVALALRHHPDLAPAERRAEAERQWREIQVAWWILGEPRLRAKLDRQLGGKDSPTADELAEQTASRLPPSERVDLERLVGAAEGALARGDHWEAAGILEKLVDRFPGEASWQRAYAQALARCGASGRAVKACEAAILVQPEEPHNHLALAEVQAEAGNFAAAARACRHTLDLDPDNVPAKELLRKATTLRVLLFRQKATIPLYVTAVLGLVAMVVALWMVHGAQ